MKIIFSIVIILNLRYCNIYRKLSENFITAFTAAGINVNELSVEEITDIFIDDIKMI